MTTADLRLGAYAAVLSGETWDALICDPPFSAKTHSGHNDARAAFGEDERREIDYPHWTPADVQAFVKWASPRTRNWLVVFTDSVLCFDYRTAFEAEGLVSFPPIPCIQPGRTKRAWGDGPPSCTDQLMVARHRRRDYINRWYPASHYIAPRDCAPGAGRVGGKPEAMMHAIVRDYSRPGDVVCDPTAGLATTLVAARGLGRVALGAEQDHATHAKALERLARPWQPMMVDAPAEGRQIDMLATVETR